MLKSFQGHTLDIECNQCKSLYQENVEGITSPFLEEHGEYENLIFRCPVCQEYEGFNLNLPMDDADEPIETYEMPLEEEVQRYYVRLLILTIREDFKQNG